MKEWKIGEIRQVNGEWYQCLESSSCRCDYCDYGELGDCRKIACASGERSDDKEVYFKKLKKVGLPYYNSYNKLCQEYKCYIVPLLTNEIVDAFADNRVVIEVKQNKKEDMEEKKFNLKPFNLEAAKAGKPVCTRDGRKVRIICFDAKCDLPIIALVTDTGGSEILMRYLSNGSFTNLDETGFDLMMFPEKKEGWAKVRKDINLYDTKEEADRKMIGNDEYVTAKVCWEE